MDDDAIRLLVTRLSRPHRAGGEVIERAAILAAGTDSAAVLDWIEAHGGQPEPVAPVVSRRGLHGARSTDGGTRRYVLPPGALSVAVASEGSPSPETADPGLDPETPR
jgi:hypothetical protein